jgi:hypothetical protein
MAKPKKPGPSEFEGKGPTKAGVYNADRVTDKLRIARRTGQDPDADPDIFAEPNDWPDQRWSEAPEPPPKKKKTEAPPRKE